MTNPGMRPQLEQKRAEPQRSRPIDLAHLARQTLGDQGIECEVMRVFEQMIAAYHARLVASRDYEHQMRHLHVIKGASAGVGAWGLAELARLAEADLIAAGTLNPELVDDIGVAVEEVRGFILSMLSEQLV